MAAQPRWDLEEVRGVRNLGKGLWLVGLCVVLGVAQAAPTHASAMHGSVASEIDAAVAIAQQGGLDEAATRLSDVLAHAPSPSDALAARLALADVQRQQGRNKAALEVLDEATPLALSDLDRARVSLRQGGVLLALARYDHADIALNAALAQGAALGAHEQISLALDLGNLASERADYAAALGHYGLATDLAASASLPDLEATARLNALRARLDDKELRAVEADLATARTTIDRLADGEPKARLLVALGDLYRRAVVEFDMPKGLRRYAFDALRAAAASAASDATRAYAYGFLGSLYEDEGRLDEALDLTRRALLAAQRVRADEQVYRWEWQSGRILRKQGEIANAQAAYGRAVTTLNAVRANFAVGSRSTFNKLVAPVYLEYADVILAAPGAGESRQGRLREVRDLLETLKQAEVQDYFANECIVRGAAKEAADLAATGVAVLYPVFLDDRVELLVEANGVLEQFTSPVSRNRITQVIRQFRVNLERSTSGDAYLVQAKQLYDWLIAPVDALLQARGVRTLVVVPEGALRTIPLSALHDGRQFLVERLAVATTPAIQLTQRTEAALPDETLLVGGLTKGVQGFSELPSVANELRTVESMYGGLAIQDEQFRLETVELELASQTFTAAHLATHGEFSSDHRKSFLLTYDDKLTMSRLKDALERRGDDAPLDLLVLSACRTAAGDDRAALGLAGVAVQSGAKSVLASLWYVSDAATASLVESFYRELKTEGTSKAESLRRAQVALLAQAQFQHPSYWAPYLMIGNWL